MECDDIAWVSGVGKASLEGLCFLCQAEKGRYKCPKCGVPSCSVKCIKRHKDELDCSGERPLSWNPLPFANKEIYRQEFQDEDKQFLDRIRTKKVEVKSVEAKPEDPNPTSILDQRKKRDCLLAECRMRDIYLVLPPLFMSICKLNKTRFEPLSSTIVWTIRFEFHSTQQPITSVIGDNIAESVTLITILKQFLSPKRSQIILRESQDASLENIPSNLKSMPLEEITCLVGNSFIDKTKKKLFTKLENDKSILENFRGLLFFDIPTISVVATSELDGYEIEPDRCAFRFRAEQDLKGFPWRKPRGGGGQRFFRGRGRGRGRAFRPRDWRGRGSRFFNTIRGNGHNQKTDGNSFIPSIWSKISQSFAGKVEILQSYQFDVPTFASVYAKQSQTEAIDNAIPAIVKPTVVPGLVVEKKLKSVDYFAVDDDLSD